MSKEVYICTAKCPELDLANEPHCVCMVESGNEREELFNKECPVGNTPYWSEVRYKDDR